MKTVFIGDLHGRSTWKDILAKEQPDHVVFMGDYFDSFDLSAAVQMHNFQELIDYKTTSKASVIMLIGNHDLHYFSGINDAQTSGFQRVAYWQINQLVEDNKHHMQMAYQYGKYLCSHAGISPEWLNRRGYNHSEGSIVRFVNDLWKHKPGAFSFADNGYGHSNPYGDDTYQTPVWIRPKSLMKACKNTTLKQDYIQIVGHTEVKSIDIKGNGTGGRYYFIDAVPSGQYLVHTEETGLTLGQLLRYDKKEKQQQTSDEGTSL